MTTFECLSRRSKDDQRTTTRYVETKAERRVHGRRFSLFVRMLHRYCLLSLLIYHTCSWRSLKNWWLLCLDIFTYSYTCDRITENQIMKERNFAHGRIHTNIHIHIQRITISRMRNAQLLVILFFNKVVYFLWKESSLLHLHINQAGWSAYESMTTTTKTCTL